MKWEIKKNKNNSKIIKFIFKKYIQIKLISWVMYELNRNIISNRTSNSCNDCTVEYILMYENYIKKLTQFGVTLIDENLRIIDNKTLKLLRK